MFALLAVGNDLGHVDFTSGVFPALSDDAEATPDTRIQK